MDEKLNKALQALADKIDHGHLLLSTDAVSFIDAVIARLEVAEAECARLRAALTEIAEATDADDPESYRCDDREGCLDWVHDKATRGQDAAGDAQ